MMGAQTSIPMPDSPARGECMNGWQLERYRPLLRLQVLQVELDPRLRARFGASDLVHEALLRAHRDIGQFRGQTEAELVGWLRTILRRAVVDQIRHEKAQERDPWREERRIHDALAESAAGLDAFVAARQPSPSEQVAGEEQRLRIARAVEQLPDDQRAAFLLRDLQGLPLKEVAARLGKTERSVAGLLQRGRRALRELLADEA
jgi:RNA polymerase sigma-70 factor (ECF subfamily)